MNKLSAHAHDRGLERLNLSPESIDAIQSAVDRMYYKHGRNKLFNPNYFSKLRDSSQNHIGYAAFKRVGTHHNGRLVLSTILSKEMRPRGDDISHFFTLNIKDKGVPRHPLEPETYKGMPAVPNNKN